MSAGISIVPGEAALAHACGFDYVELAGKCVQAMSAREFDALRRELDDAGIGCRGLNAYCPAELVISGPGANADAASSYARRLLPRARALGVKVVGIGSPFSRILPDGYDRVMARHQAIHFFRATGEVFAMAGIQVCVEALGRCYCNWINRVDEAIEIAQAVASAGVGVVVDFYNMEHEGEANRSFSEGEMGRILHAHLSDDDGSPQRRSFLRPAQADGHIARIRGLCAAGYAGDFTLEIDVPLDPARAMASLAIMRQAAEGTGG